MKRRGFFKAALALLGLKAVGTRLWPDKMRFTEELEIGKRPEGLTIPYVYGGGTNFEDLPIGTIYYARDTARFWLKKGMPNDWECLYDVKRESHIT